jgi:polar amino acid transport system permease protein
VNIFDFWPMLAEGIRNTLILSGASFGLGLLLGVPIVAMRQSDMAPVRALAAAVVELLRGIPPIAWLFVIFFGLPQFEIRLDPMPAAIWGFSLISAAYISEIYRAGLRSVPAGQTEAARALGLSTLRGYALVIAPQAIRVIIPLAIAYQISLLKESTIASVLGVSDIAGLAKLEARRHFNGMEVFISAAVMYLCMSIPIGLFGRWLGARLAAPQRDVSRV